MSFGTFFSFPVLFCSILPYILHYWTLQTITYVSIKRVDIMSLGVFILKRNVASLIYNKTIGAFAQSANTRSNSVSQNFRTLSLIKNYTFFDLLNDELLCTYTVSPRILLSRCIYHYTLGMYLVAHPDLRVSSSINSPFTKSFSSARRVANSISLPVEIWRAMTLALATSGSQVINQRSSKRSFRSFHGGKDRDK